VKPRVIVHNSVSIDGSYVNFDANLELHYRIVLQCKADIHLIGSTTAKTGFEHIIPPEESRDYMKPDKGADLPLWVIIDSKGILEGMLHVMRRFEYCRDVVLLITRHTPDRYIQYLEERQYDYYTVGDKHVDLHAALELLNGKYNAETVITDCGAILTNVLLNENLVDEVSLLIHPFIVGETSKNLFTGAHLKHFHLEKTERIDDQYIWVVYTAGTDNTSSSSTDE